MPEMLQRPEFQAIADQEQYGISFCTAHIFKHALDYKRMFGGRLEVPTFNGLHPHSAFPFHQLVCEILSGLGTFPRTSAPTGDSDIHFYSEDEIRDEDAWRRMPPLGRIGFITQDEIGKSSLIDNANKTTGFKPKYRLVINSSTNRQEGGLYHVS